MLQARLPRRSLHPCPRKRHHPGERCRCAERLNVYVPHGHSGVGDRGSLHAARLQNLRWRLSAISLGRLPGSEPRVPLSLLALTEDHLGDAVAKSVRPLSPNALRWRYPYRAARACTTCGGYDEPRSPATARTARAEVSFDADGDAEIPLILKAKKLRKLPSKHRGKGGSQDQRTSPSTVPSSALSGSSAPAKLPGSEFVRSLQTLATDLCPCLPDLFVVWRSHREKK